MELGDRFWSKVDKRGDYECWNWTAGQFIGQGYGMYQLDKKPWRAHRLMMTSIHGPIPSSTHVDHICRNRTCVNPAHLQLVTPSLNNQNRGPRGSGASTGIRNVQFYKPNGKYVAKCTLNYKRYHLGYFDTAEEAEAVVIAWRRENMPNSLMDREVAA